MPARGTPTSSAQLGTRFGLIGTRRGPKPKKSHPKWLWTWFSAQAAHVLALKCCFFRKSAATFSVFHKLKWQNPGSEATKVLEIGSKHTHSMQHANFIGFAGPINTCIYNHKYCPEQYYGAFCWGFIARFRRPAAPLEPTSRAS